jgi:MFS transporter, YQGE family, putative transporter
LNAIFHFLYHILRRYLGVKGDLPKSARRLAWMAALFEFTLAFSNVFLNVYLFKGGGDWGPVTFYNLTSFFVIPAAFAFGGWVARSGRRLFPYRAGLAFSAILFLCVLLLGEKSRDHVLGLGILSGLSIGFYFLGQHALTFEVTTNRNRDLFFSINQIFAASLRLFSPYLASRIIALFRAPDHPDLGYRILFSVTLALYLALFAESFVFEGRHERRPYEFLAALKAHLQVRFRPVLAAYLFWGIRNGIFWYIVSLLVYRASKQEITVGNYDWLTQAILLGMGYALALAARPGNRAGLLGLSAWIDVAAVGVLAWRLDIHTLLAFTAMYAVALALFKVTFYSYSFDIMEAAGGQARILENLAVREIPLAAGRILGLLAFMVSVDRFGETGLRTALFLLGSAHVPVWWILSRWKHKDR